MSAGSRSKAGQYSERPGLPRHRPVPGSANIPPEVRTLVRYRRRPVILFALLALLFAQAGAGLHALQHFGRGADPAGVPSLHTQLCLECASFAPLASVHGGGVTALSVAALAAHWFTVVVETATVDHRSYAYFRSRAPPR
jgi:hypothetical protein